MTTGLVTGAYAQTNDPLRIYIYLDQEPGDAVYGANFESSEASRTGSSVTVIGREELDEMKDQNLSDILEQTAGVTMRQRGPMGTRTDVYMRGAPSEYVPVYVDGIDISNPANASARANLTGMTGADIARIEVLKGSNSAVYGSNAIAGVINITTLRPTENGLNQSISAEVGSYQTRRLTYGLTNTFDTGSISFTMSRATSDGFSAAEEDDGNEEPDGMKHTQLSFNIEHYINPNMMVGLSVIAQDGYSEYDGRRGDDLDNFNEWDSLGYRAYTQLSTDFIDHSLEYSHFGEDRYSCTSADRSSCSPFEGERDFVKYQAGAFLGGNRLVIGTSSETETALNQDITTNSVFAENTKSFGDLTVIGSLRYDDHETFGGNVSKRVAMTYALTQQLTFRASAGDGFRAPSPYELYHPTYGNLTLDPETSTSYNVGLDYSWDTGRLSLTGFRTMTDNKIEYYYEGWNFLNGQYIQTDETTEMKGLELEAVVGVGSSLSLGGSYTRNITDSPYSSTSFSQVAGNEVSLFANYALTDDFSTLLSVDHARNRENDLKDYTVGNLTFNYDVNDSSSVYLRVENVTDREYQFVEGYGTSDRAFYAGIAHRF